MIISTTVAEDRRRDTLATRNLTDGGHFVSPNIYSQWNFDALH